MHDLGESEQRVDRSALEARIEALALPASGLFGPRSFAWRMCRERVLVTYAPRAVMLQYAFPPFAAASASYGAGARDPGARFDRAVSTLLVMIFGDRARVVREARRLFLLHDRLHGTTELGRPFHGNARESLAWVLLTLLDASIRGYERHVGAIDERALFEELPRFASLFGLGPGELPTSRAALDARVERTVERALVVGDEARAMWAFLGAGTSRRERLARRLARGWTAATLPAALRRALAPEMSDRRARQIEGAGSLLRASALPAPVRYVRAYVEATKADAAAAGRPSEDPASGSALRA